LRSPVVFQQPLVILTGHLPVCTNAISKGNNRPDINRTNKACQQAFPSNHFYLACRSWEFIFSALHWDFSMNESVTRIIKVLSNSRGNPQDGCRDPRD
jgi:hypothetical protein